MKTIKITLIGIICSFLSYAQDIKDPQRLFNANNVSILQKNANKFIKAWNWWSIDRKLDSAMRINFFQTNNTDNLSYMFPDSQMRLQQVNNIARGCKDYSTLQAPAIQFDPEIDIQNGDFDQIRHSDTSGAVFCFRYRNFVFGDTVSSENPDFNGYILSKEDFPSGLGRLKALADCWPQNAMIEMSWYGSQPPNGIIDMNDKPNSNGTRWYLSINLHTKDTITTNNESDTVLTIKMPYILYGDSDTSYIQIDSIPREDLGDIYTINSVRTQSQRLGIARNLRQKTENFSEFNITGKMLKVNSEGIPDSNITLSVYFRLNINNSSNPFLQSDESMKGKDSSRISNLGIEVFYHGNISCKVEWIRYETPHAQALLRGKLDSAIHDTLIGCFNALNGLRPGLKIHRFYCIDEFWIQNWLSHRYFNKLVDGMATSEIDHHNLPNLFLHCTDFAEIWNGNSFGMEPRIAAPYIRSTGRTAPTVWNHDADLKKDVFNYLNGYTGFNGATSAQLQDTVNSFYENFIVRVRGNGSWQFTLVPFDSVKYYGVFDSTDYGLSSAPPYYYYENQSPLSNFELHLYRNFYKPNSYLFSSKPYWVNIWASSELWQADPYPSPKAIYHKPGCGHRAKTGEEIRLMNSISLLLGTKGLVNWWGTSTADTTTYASNDVSGWIGLASYDRNPIDRKIWPAGDDLLKNDTIGSDYINITNDESKWQYWLDTNSIDWESLGHDKNHIYMGRRSVRTEIARLNKFIDAAENDLLKLRLVSWYGKGYKQWRLTHPDFNLNILDDYIDTSRIKTRPIGRVDQYDQPYYEQYTTIDSGFYDITLLRDSSDYNLTNGTIFLGVQSRRTDPLILWRDSLNGQETAKYMRFLSTAEFEDSCRISVDSLKYQSMFWKRGGAREIVLPFNYKKDPQHPEDYSLLKITELGYDNDSLNNQPWRDPKYYHTIDTIIGQDGALKVRLNPGEGKVIKVNILSPQGELKGHLAYSNQRKMIAYPAEQEHQDSTGTVDTVRYHAVYHKYNNANSKMMVFYNRSRPMKLSEPINVIDWEGEVAVSDSLVFVDSLNYIWRDSSYDCSYPSIVVRYDESIDSPKVYIVYTCERTNSTGGENKVSIVESILNANDTVPLIQRVVPPANVIALANGNDMDVWGTPMINASANGNYYAWSDSLKGIVAGWKPPDSLHFETELSKTNIHWFPTQGQGTIALHPSLNSYSKPRFGMDNCALAWMERRNFGTDLEYNIYYTRLRIDQDRHIINYVPLDRCDTKGDFFATYDSLQTMVRLTNPDSDTNIRMFNNSFPTINRTVGNDVLEYNNAYNPQDFVFWSSIDNWQQDTIIYCTAFFNLDTLDNQSNEWLPFCWHNYYLSYIRIPNQRLFHPNVSQGYLSLRQGLGGQLQYLTHENDSLLVLNFEAKLDVTSTNSDIWQINHSLFSFFHHWDTLMTDLTDYSYAHKLDGRGRYPHLAAMPTVESNHEWNQNRRIFETGTRTPPKIVTSVQHFYKKFTDVDFVYPFFGFDDLKMNNSMFSAVWLSDRNRNFHRMNIHPFIRTGNIYAPADTIYSDWFQLKDIRKLYYFTHGKPSNNVQMKIERKSDRKKNIIPTLFKPDHGFTNHQITFINSGDHQYRLVWYKTDTTTHYVEELIIGSLPGLNEMEWGMDNDRLAKTGVNLNEQVIDLGETEYSDPNDYLSIYPNPAEDKVFVTVSKPGAGSCRIELISALGQVVLTSSANISSSTEINIQGISPGLYIVRALLPNGEVLQNSFVLSR